MPTARKPVVIFGTADFARVACVYLRADSPHEVAAFTVHQSLIDYPQVLGLDVVQFETIEQSHPPDRFAMLVAVGFKGVNRLRADIYRECKSKGYELISYVNSKVVCWDKLEIGDNCFIFENNVIQPFVKIGNNVVIWSGNHIGHDVSIGDHCFIASHAVISGNVSIGPYCFIGVNATFRDGVKVGTQCVIGAGAVILKDTKDDEVYATKSTPSLGVPSHDLKSFQ